MPQKFAFTTAAMAAALEETPVTYEDLADIERDFNDVETEIIRQEAALTSPLYARRQKLTTAIPNFWPLVLEQAPPDIDQYIQPSDSALLLSSLLTLTVTNFEMGQPGGDPRSIAIRFEFAPNEYFEDAVLEKKLWHRRSRDGWTGLVSEPVRIQWKRDRDLTGGLLGMVCAAWEAEQRAIGAGTKVAGLSPEQRALMKKIDNTGMGGLSFFAWFGFIGRRVSAEESAAAIELEEERRRRGEGARATVAEAGSSPVDCEDEDDEDVGMSLEIFPDGDDLAMAFSGDLWPNAIKYFTQAQEQDALSDADFESDDESKNGRDDDEEDEEDEDVVESNDEELPPNKKRRSS